MKFVSTRRGAPAVTLSDAILAGLAPDGGLYVPASVPRLDPAQLESRTGHAAIAEMVLAPFFDSDPLREHLSAICAESFDIPVTLRPLGTPDDHVLELFHGPTAAFKDFGARFLAAVLARLDRPDDRPLTILVATSGDTGAAVASAFHRRDGVRVIVLYPDGRVSPRQAHQLGCFGDNVTTLRVGGSFDDCQRLVKTALADEELQAHVRLTSANSISLGRFLPQIAYYGIVATEFGREHHRKLNFVIPTGNLGNALAALYAHEMRAPVGEIALATNANDVLPRFFNGAAFEPRQSIATIANAMDVGLPSNFERLQFLFPDDRELRRAIYAFSVSDDEIRAAIRSRFDRFGELFCPHTATAVHALEELRRRGTRGDWAAVATAHPAKFEEIVEPLAGEVEIPATLRRLLAQRSESIPISSDYDSLRDLLLPAQ